MSNDPDVLYQAYRDAQDRVAGYSRRTPYLHDVSRLRLLLSEAEDARQAWLAALNEIEEDAA